MDVPNAVLICIMKILWKLSFWKKQTEQNNNDHDNQKKLEKKQFDALSPFFHLF